MTRIRNASDLDRFSEGRPPAPDRQLRVVIFGCLLRQPNGFEGFLGRAESTPDRRSLLWIYASMQDYAAGSAGE